MKISVRLFNQADFENFENKKILQNLGFEAKYGQTCFYYQNIYKNLENDLENENILFVGLELKKVKTFDPFYKVDFFHLGAKIAQSLDKMKVEIIEIDYISDFPPASDCFESKKEQKLSKNLLDLQLGIKQKLWKFDKYKTNLQDREKTGTKTLIKINLTTNLNKQFSQFDALKLESLNLGMNLNRFVVEETPEFFNPKTAVQIVQKELNYPNVGIKVRDYDWLLANGFGGVCAVGRASENKPNLVHAQITLGNLNKTQNTNSQNSSQNSFQIDDQNVKIRQAKLSDLSQMFEILKNCRIEMQTNSKLGLTRENAANFDTAKSFENLQKEFELQNNKNSGEKNTQFWVLEINSKIAGFIQIIYKKDWIELGKIYLQKDWQNQGLGSRLLAHTLQNLEVNQDVKVEVVEFNESAIKLYQKFGFVQTENKLKSFVQPSGHQIPAIEMILKVEKLIEIQKEIAKSNFGKEFGSELDQKNAPNIVENKPTNPRQTNRVLTFGTPGGSELKNPRENVRGVLFDPKLQKYCLIQMENLPFFLVGGGVEGEDLKTALAREIEEELGYFDFEIKGQLGKEILSYCPREKVDKIEKTFCSETGFLVVLNSQNQKQTNLSKMEKTKKLTKIWKTSEEISQIWQDDKAQNPQLEPFWEILVRGVSKAIQIGLDKTSSPDIFDKEFITRIVLIGKGLTYDSGGLDIKTDGHMKEMKTDMGGSGLMFGVIKTLAELSNSKEFGKNNPDNLQGNFENIQQNLSESYLKELNQNSPKNQQSQNLASQEFVSKEISEKLSSDKEAQNSQEVAKDEIKSEKVPNNFLNLALQNFKQIINKTNSLIQNSSLGLVQITEKTTENSQNENSKIWDKNLQIQEILNNLNLGTSENMIFGKPVGNESESPRINVRGVIWEPKSEKFCFVQGQKMPYLSGGGTDGEDLQTALRREISEELGYTDFEIKSKLGEPIISNLKHKDLTNKICSDTGFLVILNSLAKTETNLSEEEKQENLREIWLSSGEILDIWQTNLTKENPYLGYYRHLEIFRRGIVKLEELNLVQNLEKLEESQNENNIKNNFVKKDWDLATLRIETERLILKPISLDFTNNIFEEFTAEITEYMYPKPNENLEETKEFIQKVRQTDIEKTELHLVIQNKNSEFLGVIGLHELKTKNPKFGIWLKKSAHGNKYGQEAANGLKTWANDHLNYKNLLYPVDQRNIGSRKVAESLGGILQNKPIENKINASGNNLEIVEYQIKNPNYQDFSLQNQNGDSNPKNISQNGQIEIHWLTAFCENSVNSDSYRSDDILTTFSGQTVEVWNTDAEGRLTLADVLSYATLLEPDFMLDAATLTGACVVANSCHFTGLMGNDENLNQNLITSFIDNNEHTVQNHFPEILRESVCGDLGDLVNTGKLQRQAGHITAGLFLSHFIDQNNWRPQILEKYQIKSPKTYAWTHLDIAGSAFNKKQNNLETDGATGQSVRSLVDWILNLTY